jgi:hypothetical protein
MAWRNSRREGTYGAGQVIFDHTVILQHLAGAEDAEREGFGGWVERDRVCRRGEGGFEGHGRRVVGLFIRV